ncbi:leucine--tRNA ligase [Candidatus Roizmanbacteria bacterium RIFCSPLOWO2_01_FULL_44_13]|uniref:Leucine--tRNA ligase n=1 Tax=Candidatus Roizmanbacteria bacterium RIFCSPLOWO2_01_FULL_44_13 TaxID=1802069 RepID=A0A1F7JAW9_9BACT|nr:MAG: leucine--tRNA ligase [Candidatus Roizmanbacteria bacterium RIFCSPLOWO2_01_FULL_44_13]
MKNKYQPAEFEKNWLEKWKKEKLNVFDPNSDKKKYYSLVELPYTSGDLHIGHWFAFTAPDVLSRFKRMSGFNVFFPMGYDAFGLPAENAAIKHKIHPKDWTMKNIETMTNQFQQVGTMIDWDWMTITCLQEYYRWNQWIFLKLYEKGLAYRGKAMSNWCERDQTVLANENIENGRCWRCGEVVVQKEVEQWFLKITEYAEKLIWPENPQVDWPAAVRAGQNNWIGKKEGVLIKHKAKDLNIEFETFSAFPAWLWADTYIAIAPEHPLVERLVAGTAQEKEVKIFVKKMKQKTAEQRLKEIDTKEGVFTGRYARDPFGGEDMPIWVANFALMDFGTGIIRCSAHDTRDYEFAKKYKIKLKEVVDRIDPDYPISAHGNRGVLKNSGPFAGKKVEENIEKIVDWIVKEKIGKRHFNYHIRDWSISRQRYWGTPVPMIHCPKDGMIAVPYENLPVELPYEVDFTPHGKPPLATNAKWLHVKCPKCGGAAKRDAETLDTFFDSAWYWLRYLNPKYEKGPFDLKRAEKFTPVDIYFGGAEHTLGHTLYARFFTKFFKNLGLLDHDEFALKRVQHGIVLGPDGNKMSKSKGNVINPDSAVAEYGSDTVRLYLCFMMPYEGTGPWSDQTIAGVNRFLTRVWNIFQSYSSSSNDKKLFIKLQKTIKKVTSDIKNIKMNTAIAAMMEFLNDWERNPGGISKDGSKKFLQILAPFAPFITEEIWRNVMKEKQSIHLSDWPKLERIIEEEIVIPVQVNGKVRNTIKISQDMIKDQKAVEKIAAAEGKVKKYLTGKTYKTIYVPGKILNFILL